MDCKEIILRELKRKKKISSKQVAKLCRMSRQAAQAHLATLVQIKKLSQVGKTCGTYYISFSQKSGKRIKFQRKKYS